MDHEEDNAGICVGSFPFPDSSARLRSISWALWAEVLKGRCCCLSGPVGRDHYKPSLERTLSHRTVPAHLCASSSFSSRLCKGLPTWGLQCSRAMIGSCMQHNWDDFCQGFRVTWRTSSPGTIPSGHLPASSALLQVSRALESWCRVFTVSGSCTQGFVAVVWCFTFD